MALAERQRAEKEQTALLESRLNRLARPDVSTHGGKAGKLEFRSEDGLWSMKLNGRLQVRAEVQQGESGNRSADQTNFSIPRGRIGFSGRAGHERLSYKLEIDTPTQSTTNAGTRNFSLRDAYLDVALPADEGSKFGVRAGQFKFPFGREVLAASTRTALVDRTIASIEFSPSREPGVMLAGELFDGKLQVFGGVSNGEGNSGANQDGQDGSSSTGLRRGVRIVAHPLGQVAEDMSAFGGFGEGGSWETKVAFGGSFMVNDDQPQDGNGDGTLGDARSDDTSVGYEVQVVSGPLALVYEWFKRRADLDGGAADIDDDGRTVHLAYQPVPNVFEIAAAVSRIDFDADDDLVEKSLGFTYFLDKHNSKVSLDITRRENRTSADSDALRYRLQSQTVF